MSFYGPTSSSKLQRSGSQNDARIAGLYGSFSTFDLKFHYYTRKNFSRSRTYHWKGALCYCQISSACFYGRKGIFYNIYLYKYVF